MRYLIVIIVVTAALLLTACTTNAITGDVSKNNAQAAENTRLQQNTTTGNAEGCTIPEFHADTF